MMKVIIAPLLFALFINNFFSPNSSPYKKFVTAFIRACFFMLVIIFTSCYGLKPTQVSGNIQPLTSTNLNSVDGDYNVFSNDTSHRTLEDALTNTEEFNFEQRPANCDRVRLKAIDNNRIEVSVFKNDKIVRQKRLKGRISNNYFSFSLRKFAIKYVLLNGFSFANSRIALLKNGDLTLDCSAGGFLMLVIIPTFGSGDELYGLIYKRRSDCK